MTDLEIHHIDASWIAVTTEDPGIKEDLYQFFRYKEPTFTPNKFSKWDGDVRLYDRKSGKISYGLFSTILQFAKDRGLSVKVDDSIKSDLKPVTQEEINSWVDSLDIRNAKGEKLDPYDYQREGLYLSIKYSRMTLLAATSAGKSLLIYMIIRFLSLTTPGKILLVVPSINLVTQMKKDFGEYSMNDDAWNVDEECHEVYDGRSPYTSKKVVISTWQSLKDLDAGFFHPFTAMIGDECLHPDTPITMSGGTTKSIKEVLVGDLVLTKNEQTGELEEKPVIEVYKNMHHSYSEKRLRLKIAGKELIITANHKLRLKDGTWKRADELVVGDDVDELEIS